VTRRWPVPGIESRPRLTSRSLSRGSGPWRTHPASLSLGSASEQNRDRHDYSRRSLRSKDRHTVHHGGVGQAVVIGPGHCLPLAEPQRPVTNSAPNTRNVERTTRVRTTRRRASQARRWLPVRRSGRRSPRPARIRWRGGTRRCDRLARRRRTRQHPGSVHESVHGGMS